MREAVAAMMTIAWGSRPRSAIARLFVVVGVITTLCLMITVCLLAVGWWQWQKEGDAIESPSKRYAVWHATIVYPRLRFGLVMYDREEGKQAVVAGWTRGYPWSKKIEWAADDHLRIEYVEQNSLRWGRRTELLGVTVEWVMAP